MAPDVPLTRVCGRRSLQEGRPAHPLRTPPDPQISRPPDLTVIAGRTSSSSLEDTSRPLDLPTSRPYGHCRKDVQLIP
ncbi:kinesin-like protein [Dorcoceras hygrometricum]|uniref:Kinesin-like protein n=1 Tax=Dorcoceras hygrometricum TaxID=472368 RepID=A0A2Z7B4X4_9LAMI|nr:kinesin-like protein [Dorcoceras hygrometricum]